MKFENFEKKIKLKNIDKHNFLFKVMSMGFTSTEARLALRATFNNVDAAVEQIFKKKQLEKESKELEKQKEYSKKLDQKYGLTLNGNKS